MVAAGGVHVLVMTTDGELWTWGDNSRSQLGLGKRTVRQTQPTHLQVRHFSSCSFDQAQKDTGWKNM